MTKLFWKSLLISPAVLGTALLVSSTAMAADNQQSVKATSEFTAIASDVELPNVAESTIAQVPPATTNSNSGNVLDQLNRYSTEGQQFNTIDQVTSVSQLRDVSPADWAYEALRNLVNRYNCIEGYPDQTFRGNRALTRFEFAAGLNSCLQTIERLIAASTADFVTRDDLRTLERLIQEFEAELATLGTRVDALEGRVAFLEENQFSTTTKLKGEAIFALTDTFGENGEDTNTIFGDRVRLTLATSFTGRDELITRLAAGNLSAFDVADPDLGAPFASGVDPSTTQTFNLSPQGNNDVAIDWLAYYFPFGSSQVYLAATGGIHSDYVPTLNPYFEDYDGGNGALSTFAQENPIYRIGGGAGAAISLGAGPLERVLGPSTITVGYLGGTDANSPFSGDGFLNGDYAALGQLNFNIGDRIGIGATYVHGYHGSGSPIFGAGASVTDITPGTPLIASGVVGSNAANHPGLAKLGDTVPTVTNSYGVELAFRLSEKISISGFGTYTDAILINRGDAEIWTYGAGVALADFGKPGNILGIFGGAQPYLGDDYDVPYHVEAFYKYQLTDNISVTPGVIWLTNPDQTDDDDAFIGTLRTTFTF